MTDIQPDRREYIKAYQRERIKFRKLNLNTGSPDDMAMMDWIDAQPEGASNYLKRLIRADMARKPERAAR